MNKYHIITIGCQMNKSDSERVASVLEAQGFKRSDDKYRADLVVINTCGVRQPAEDRIYGLIPGIKEKNQKAKIVLTGCLVNREDVKRRLKACVDDWLPIANLANFKFQIPIPLASRDLAKPDKSQTNPDSSRFARSGEARQIPNKFKNIRLADYLSIKPKYNSKFSAFVPIGNGCDNFCSYCVVPYARGREVWRPAEEILDEVRRLVKRGYKEIVLIAQNVNSYKSIRPPLNLPLPRCYDRDKSKGERVGADFADLLMMVNAIKGEFRIRFLTSHPKDMSDKLIKTIVHCEKVLQEIHLPAQSGDNEILNKMNRKYTVEHYKKIIKKIRRFMPKVIISTDIIVGFPGETKKQFNNTVKFFKEIKFDKAYIARYSPRPGTAAFKLADDVAWAEKKKRWQALNFLLK